MAKVWKSIPGYPGYSASSDGELRNDKTGNISKGGDAGAYYKVSVYAAGDDKPKLCYLHDLICRAFHGKPGKNQVVLHKDDNKKNCRPSNLKWGSQSENIKSAYDNGLISKESLTNINAAGLKAAIQQLSRKYGVPVSEFVISSGAGLMLHGLRDHITDIDLGVSKPVFEKITKAANVKPIPLPYKGYSKRRAVIDDIDLIEEAKHYNTETIDGLTVFTLASLLDQKEELADLLKRDKDYADIAKIKKAIEERGHGSFESKFPNTMMW